jgi:hypothetical protein
VLYFPAGNIHVAIAAITITNNKIVMGVGNFFLDLISS